MKAHIANIASLDTVLSAAGSDRAASALARRYRAQIDENKRRLAEAAGYKIGLQKHLISGDISKADYKALKASYAEDAQRLQNAVQKLTRELDDILAGGSERQRWIERFGEVSNLTELDRRTVVYMVHSICIAGKETLDITFNYQPEYSKSNGEVA